MGDLQSQQDSPLRPYGHDGTRATSASGSSIARGLVWAGVVMQGLLFAVLAADEVNWLPSQTDRAVIRYAWIASLVAVVVTILAWIRLRNARRSLDVVGFAGSLTLSGAGGLQWAFLAYVFAQLGY